MWIIHHDERTVMSGHSLPGYQFDAVDNGDLFSVGEG
jgi:hypothetical protein